MTAFIITLPKFKAFVGLLLHNGCAVILYAMAV